MIKLKKKSRIIRASLRTSKSGEFKFPIKLDYLKFRKNLRKLKVLEFRNYYILASLNLLSKSESVKIY